MGKGHLLVGTVMAAAALAAFGPPVQAKTITYTDNFSFGLTPPLREDVASPEIDDVNLSYVGNTPATLSQFDTQGGARVLQKVDLTLTMNIQGNLFVGVLSPTIASQRVTLQQEEEEGEVEVQFNGSVQAGGLNASDSQTFEGDVSDADQSGFIPLNANLAGADSTTTNFADFLGTGNIDPAPIAASLEVLYGPEAIGRAEVFTASGNVQVTYTYRDVVTTVPTPAAAGAGLLMLLMGAVSRRRRHG